MKCLRCEKLLKAFAVSIPGPDGPVGWGPKCAQAVLVRRKRQRWVVAPAKQQLQWVDPRQMDLLEVLA